MSFKDQSAMKFARGQMVQFCMHVTKFLSAEGHVGWRASFLQLIRCLTLLPLLLSHFSEIIATNGDDAGLGVQ